MVGEHQQVLEKALTDLVNKLQAALGERLVSVVLYGSAAAGDWQKKSSDLNVLCVLDRITSAELAKSQPIFHWWRQQGSPVPLLMTAAEVGTSTDCFPMEFHDMREFRRVLFGPDLIKDLVVENTFYRAQVEHELRAKQIRLRQKAAELLPYPEKLLKLLTDSISTFCVLGRHLLILSDNPPRWKKSEIVAALETALKMPLKTFSEILAARETGKLASGVSAVSLLDGYLRETDALVRFVDGLEK